LKTTVVMSRAWSTSVIASQKVGPDDYKGFNAGMRGVKSTVFEGGHRVPFFIHWPARRVKRSWKRACSMNRTKPAGPTSPKSNYSRRPSLALKPMA
jgi:hypothetical protein